MAQKLTTTLAAGALIAACASVPVFAPVYADNGGGAGYYRWVPAKPGEAANGASRIYPGSGGITSVSEFKAGASVVLGGTVVPYAEVTLTAQVPGRVEYIAGAEGDWSDAGQVLVAIDNDDLLARRNQAVAGLRNAEAAMRNTRVQFSRELWAPRSRDIGRMPGMGLPSLFDQFFTRGFAQNMGYGNPWLERQADLYSQGVDVTQAQGQLISAQSGLQEVDAKLRDTQAIAPFSGVIVRKLAEVGDTVQPGQPLLHFADTRFLQVEVEVPARLVSGLQRDMRLPVVLDVGGIEVPGRVAQIFPVADSQRHTVKVKLDLPQDTPGGPGMYAEVRVPDTAVAGRAVAAIPSTAVVWRGSLPAVFVINGEGLTELRLLRLGEKVGGGKIAVLSGLGVGESVVTRPHAGMKSGDRVSGAGGPQ